MPVCKVIFNNNKYNVMKESILDPIVCLDHLMTIFIAVSIASPVQLAHM